MSSISLFLQKIEPWESEMGKQVEELNDEMEDGEEDEKRRKKRKNPKRIRLIDGALYRMNQYGKYFKMQIKVKHWCCDVQHYVAINRVPDALIYSGVSKKHVTGNGSQVIDMIIINYNN